VQLALKLHPDKNKALKVGEVGLGGWVPTSDQNPALLRRGCVYL
jgi:hypothetical protein